MIGCTAGCCGGSGMVCYIQKMCVVKMVSDTGIVGAAKMA